MNPTGDPFEAPERRVTWANQENARRREAYETARVRWRELGGALREMVETASGIRTVHPEDPPHVPLRHGEIILWASRAVGLVEPKANLQLGAVDYRAFDLATLSVETYGPADTTRDEGIAVVTNQRVIFRGEHSGREWAYGRLTGLTHETSRPATLMRIDNRKWASGLLTRPADVPAFRFAVTLGLADHLGHRTDLITHLKDMLAAHSAAEPMEPEPVGPEDAPASALQGLPRPGRRLVLATGAGAMALAVVLGLLGALGSLSSGPEPSSDAGAGVAGAPDAGLYEATGSPEGRTLTPRPKRSPSATPTPTPTRSKRKPQTPNLCGAPENPYGYNFCGGSVVTDPPSGTCRYFSCDSLNGGKGYLVQCSDGTMSLTGGRPNACASHDGVARTVYK